MIVLLRLDDADVQRPAHLGELVGGLLDELVAVCEDQRPAAAAGDQVGEDNGFARAGRQDDELPVDAAGVSGGDGVERLELVVARPERGAPRC